MKLLVGSSPAPGHLLPLLPLADAARAAGHDVAFLTAPEMGPFLGERQLLAAGPGLDELFAETAHRLGSESLQMGPNAAELFAGVRVDLTWDEARARAEAYEPDLIIGEWVDVVAPLLATHLDVPWAAHSIGGPLPVEVLAAMEDRSRRQHDARDLVPRARIALLDLFPAGLLVDGDPDPEQDRIMIRPGVHSGAVEGAVEGAVAAPRRADGSQRPVVLLTTGTSIDDADLLDALASSLVAAGAEVLVTAASAPDHDHVHAIGFVPLADVLPTVDAVVGSAGSGTLLATLAAGLPSVLLPMVADQPANAARAAARHVAVVIAGPDEAGSALRRVLADEQTGACVAELRVEIERMPSPADALDLLLDRR